MHTHQRRPTKTYRGIVEGASECHHIIHVGRSVTQLSQSVQVTSFLELRSPHVFRHEVRTPDRHERVLRSRLSRCQDINKN